MEMWVLWLILTVVFAVIEAATLGLTTVWCAIGSAVAAVMAMFGAPVPAQLITMIAVSVVCFIICMIWIKPKLESLRRKNVQKTNADRLIGREGVVIVPFDSVNGKGQVKVDGQIWSANAEEDFNEGTKITVKAIEGVKLVVERVI